MKIVIIIFMVVLEWLMIEYFENKKWLITYIERIGRPNER
jgi:hypothetical protein